MQILDKEIIIGCRANKPEFQKLLLQKYSGYMMAVIKRYCPNNEVAKDVLQESWIQFFLNIKEYEECGKLKSWLSRIAISQCFRVIRKTKIRTVQMMPSEVPNCESLAISNLNYNDLMNIVNQLREVHRNVFVLYVVDGLSHKEISQLLQINESTSRVHLSNARSNLKKLLSISSNIT